MSAIPGSTLLLAADQKPKEKMPVAAVVTVYHRNAHADVIVGKVLEGWRQDGGPGPDLKLVSMYTDQVPQSDLSIPMSKKHGFRLTKTIEEALTLGTGSLAVGGVLIIGEHGKYPMTPDTQQVMHPRRRFFDEVVATFRKYNKIVPIFNDKHLSYAWADAWHMYETAKKMHIPFMAGSSVPVAWRSPSTTIPLGAEVTEAVALGYGPLEHYGFHALEGMQCLLERRKGGETGVKSVQAVQGDEILKARDAGRWSQEIFDAVVAVSPTPYYGKVPRPKQMAKDAVFYLIDYRDGTKATVAMGTGFTHEFSCALKIRNSPKPFALTYVMQDESPFAQFEHLLRAIEQMFQTGKAVYPIERTLLTTGILDAALHSLAAKSKQLDTPELAVAYQPVDWPFPQGKLWRYP
jgi:hypothetical protein